MTSQRAAGSKQRPKGGLRTIWVALAVALILGVMAAAPVFAQDVPPGEEVVPASMQGPFQVYADDGGSWELGVHGTAGNLPAATAAERYGMWYWLSDWFVRRHYLNESSAWEKDFKRSALGGYEQYYIDNVDLQFYVGHGAPGRFTFAHSSSSP